MSTAREKAAADRALRAWKAKRCTDDRPPGFDEREAAAITGIPAETLDEWYGLGFLQPSLTWWHEDDDCVERFSELDLVQAMIAADLAAAGVPKLALALTAIGLQRTHEMEGDWGAMSKAESDPSARGLVLAYPLTTATAERWLHFGNVYAVLWSEANIADTEIGWVEDAEAEKLSEADIAETKAWHAEHADQMRAEAADVRAAIEAGEAVAYDARQAVGRLSAALDAWWVAHADDRPTSRP